MCGSFCTHSKSLRALGSIVGEGWDVLPVMSECVWDTDTRFGTSEELKKRVTELAGCEIIHTVKEAERLGPEIALEYMIIAPCTGNTLAKLACGITDTAVCMAAKAHMRSERPLLIALASNDAISANLGNIGRMPRSKSRFRLSRIFRLSEDRLRQCARESSFARSSIDRQEFLVYNTFTARRTHVFRSAPSEASRGLPQPVL